MGLCKCPRKKVTNLFCFQHKVNVCEHCVVASHPKCIVQSYLRWLRDSDFRPVCTICNVGLEDDDAGECVRLMCFDVFHWRCLDRLCRTVPAGGDLTHYKCPSCQTPVFPADNVVSPLAEALRAVLSGANWARSGLGLPEVPSSDFDVSFEQTGDEMSGYDPSVSYDEEYNMSASSDWLPNKDNYDGSYAEANQQKSASLFQTSQEELSMANGDDHVITMSANDVEATMRGDPPPHYDKGPPKRGVDPPTQMNGLHKVHGGAAESHGYDGYGDQRSAIGMRNIDSHFRVTSGAVQPPDSKEHDDKYRRRTPALWTKVNNWPKFRRFVVTISTYKLFILVIFLCLVGFILVDSFIKYGRTMADKEPFLDPMANPNIRVNSQ